MEPPTTNTPDGPSVEQATQTVGVEFHDGIPRVRDRDYSGTRRRLLAAENEAEAREKAHMAASDFENMGYEVSFELLGETLESIDKSVWEAELTITKPAVRKIGEGDFNE